MNRMFFRVHVKTTIFKLHLENCMVSLSGSTSLPVIMTCRMSWCPHSYRGTLSLQVHDNTAVSEIVVVAAYSHQTHISEVLVVKEWQVWPAPFSSTGHYAPLSTVMISFLLRLVQRFWFVFLNSLLSLVNS